MAIFNVFSKPFSLKSISFCEEAEARKAYKAAGTDLKADTSLPKKNQIYESENNKGFYN